MTHEEAAELRAHALRVAKASGDLYHRVICADPYMELPETEPACNRLAQGYMNATALAEAIAADL